MYGVSNRSSRGYVRYKGHGQQNKGITAAGHTKRAGGGGTATAVSRRLSRPKSNTKLELTDTWQAQCLSSQVAASPTTPPQVTLTGSPRCRPTDQTAPLQGVLVMVLLVLLPVSLFLDLLRLLPHHYHHDHHRHQQRDCRVVAPSDCQCSAAACGNLPTQSQMHTKQTPTRHTQ